MKKLLMSACTLALCFTINPNVSAKATNILVKDSLSGKYYQYGFNDIKIAAEDNFLGISSELYDEYKKNISEIVAIEDDVKGYVDYNSIKIASEDAVVFNKVFNLNEYTANISLDKIVNPTFNIQKRVLKGDQVADGEVISADDIKDFDVINIY